MSEISSIHHSCVANYVHKCRTRNGEQYDHRYFAGLRGDPSDFLVHRCDPFAQLFVGTECTMVAREVHQTHHRLPYRWGYELDRMMRSKVF